MGDDNGRGIIYGAVFFLTGLPLLVMGVLYLTEHLVIQWH